MSKYVQVLRAEDYDVKTGEKEYVIELQRGDVQIDYVFYADKIVHLYVGLGVKVIPFGSGFCVQGRLRIKDGQWIMIKTMKEALVACQVFVKEITISETLDMTPSMVNMVPPPVVDMRAMVDRLVAQKLEDTYGKGRLEVEVDELLDDMPDDVDKDFGVGFMDMDEEHTEQMIQKVRARNVKAKVSPKEGEDVKSDAKKSNTPEEIPKDKPEAAE